MRGPGIFRGLVSCRWRVLAAAFIVKLMLLNAYVDDSASEEDGRELVLAGYFATTHVWKKFSAAWRFALRESPSIEFLHATEAESRKKQFSGWATEARDQKLMRLAKVINSHALRSFECRMSRDSFDKILKPYCLFDFRTPYSFLFDAVITTAVRQMEALNIAFPVEFIFDNQDKTGDEAALMYGPYKSMQRPEWKWRMARPPIFRSDVDTPPLQAADVLAWHLRRSREPRCRHEKREALSLLRTDKHVESWISDEVLEHIASQFSELVSEEDRLNPKASTVQTRKQIARAVERLPTKDQDEAHEYLRDTFEAIQRNPELANQLFPQPSDKGHRRARRSD